MKTEASGIGVLQSHIVVGDYAFATSYSDVQGDLHNLKRHLLCVHRHPGDVVWSQVVRSTSRENCGSGFGTAHCYATHTPVDDGKHVYVLCGNSGVLAFELKGKGLWKKDAGKENSSMFGSGASPILYKNCLIVTNGIIAKQCLRAKSRCDGTHRYVP